MSWGDKTAVTGLGASLSETSNLDTDYVAASHFSGGVSLNPGESAHVQISCAFASAGSDLFYRVVATLDDSSETWDNLPLMSGSLAFSASSTVVRSFIVSGVKRFRIEVRKGGTTSGSYTPSASWRKNGISI